MTPFIIDIELFQSIGDHEDISFKKGNEKETHKKNER